MLLKKSKSERIREMQKAIKAYLKKEMFIWEAKVSGQIKDKKTGKMVKVRYKKHGTYVRQATKVPSKKAVKRAKRLDSFKEQLPLKKNLKKRKYKNYLGGSRAQKVKREEIWLKRAATALAREISNTVDAEIIKNFKAANE